VSAWGSSGRLSLPSHWPSAALRPDGSRTGLDPLKSPPRSSGGTPLNAHFSTPRCSPSEQSWRWSVRRAPTLRLLPLVNWKWPLAWLTLLLVAMATPGCGTPPVVIPPPVLVSPVKPPLFPDRRAEVLARMNEIAYVGSEVRMPADLWRLASRITAEGWANAKALERAGWGEKR
jgi:hypothetical protein